MNKKKFSPYHLNFLSYYNNREEIYKTPELFWQDTGERLFPGTEHIPLGIYLKTIDENPELFIRKGWIIFAFGGSPISSASINLLVNPANGRYKHLTEGGFWKKHMALREQMTKYSNNEEH